MRQTSWVWLWLFVFGLTSSAAPQRGAEGSSAADQFLGTWTGTWDGAGSGGFELTLEKSTDGPVIGKLSVTGEPTYKTTIKTLSFAGGKMTAVYDFPPDERAEVSLDASFDGNAATGTWLLREKGAGELARGTWAVTRK